MAVIALEKEYPKIIKEYKIKAIGRREITLTKLAENNPLGFKIKTSVLRKSPFPITKDSPPHRRASSKSFRLVGGQGGREKQKSSLTKGETQRKGAKKDGNSGKTAEEIKQDMPKFLSGNGKRQNGGRNKEKHRPNGDEMGRLSGKHIKKNGRRNIKKDWEKTP